MPKGVPRPGITQKQRPEATHSVGPRFVRMFHPRVIRPKARQGTHRPRVGVQVCRRARSQRFFDEAGNICRGLEAAMGIFGVAEISAYPAVPDIPEKYLLSVVGFMTAYQVSGASGTFSSSTPTNSRRSGSCCTSNPAHWRVGEERPSAATTNRACTSFHCPLSSTHTVGMAPGHTPRTCAPRHTSAPAAAAAVSKISCMSG